MPINDSFQGVSNCYVFKSRLQEYAQKVGVPTPVYETIKEGPSHEPYFKSSVIVNDVRYDSLPGFSNRKAAEQSAAEVALLELAKSGDVDQSISLPVHETGLCKNLLQEYAQKMNYAIPLYQCQTDDAPGRTTLFQCTIEIGGIRYIGASAKTKKEAEIKAARTALLAIQSLAVESGDKPIESTQLTVLPCKKRPAEPVISKSEDTHHSPRKAKRVRVKRKPSKGMFAGIRKKESRVENPAKLDQHVEHDREQMGTELTPNPHDGTNQLGTETFTVEGSSVSQVSEPTPNQRNDGNSLMVSCGTGYTAPVAKDVNGVVSDVRDMNVEKLTNSSTAMGGLVSDSSVATNSMS